MKDVYLIDNKWGWIKKAFTDLAFTFFSSFLYYHDKDLMDEEQLSIYQKGMAAFGGIAPTYHIELRDKSVMIYEFIDKIVIHEADKLTGERIQQVDIYLKYVGTISGILITLTLFLVFWLRYYILALNSLI